MYVYLTLYVLCICYAMWTDATSLTIPNVVSIVLVALFLPFSYMTMDIDAFLGHGGIAAVVFAIALIFYAFGWMGGGDVKFMSAASLWVGPGLILQFLFNLALIGALVAILILLTRKYADLWRGVAAKMNVIAFIIELADARKVPYGIPIGCAALLAIPKIFGT